MTLLDVLEGAVPAVAFLLMVAVGLDVSTGDIRQLLRARRLVVVGTVAQVVLLPLAALVILWIAPQDARIGEYLLLIAACPGGGMSNVYVYLARANTALSVALTATSCLVAPITLPMVMTAYAWAATSSASFDLPIATLVGQLLIMAVIPVLLGAYSRFRWPGFERRHGRHLRAITAAGVVLIVAIGLVQSAGAMTRAVAMGSVAAAALVIAGMLGGWLVGRWSGSAPADTFTLLVEFAVRNLAIAMVIEVSLLGHPEFIAFGALALLAQAAFLLVAVRLYGR
jgi:BASS family bile acid:Na+ symporter